MRLDEPNELRIKILRQVIAVIAKVYSGSQANGQIKAIRFLNNGGGVIDITGADAVTAIDSRGFGKYDDITRIGTEQENLVNEFVVPAAMNRPLLIMVITDGDVRTRNNTPSLQMYELKCYR